MGLRRNPSYRQRRLGAELRRLRLESRLTATRAGAELGFSAAHLNNIEAGRTAVPVMKLRALAKLYGCANDQLVDELAAMSQSNGHGWWSEYQRPPHNDAARDLAELESRSVRHRNFQLVTIPGLLQTADYMLASFRIGQPEASVETLERFVDFRLRRQRVLTGPRPMEFHGIIHEAALRMEFPGREVMRRQLEHLVEMTQLPNVRIQVLPFQAETYPAAFACPFDCYDSVVPELGTVYVEHPTVSPFLFEQAVLAQFSDGFDKLGKVALPSIELAGTSNCQARTSLGLIEQNLYDM